MISKVRFFAPARLRALNRPRGRVHSGENRTNDAATHNAEDAIMRNDFSFETLEGRRLMSVSATPTETVTVNITTTAPALAEAPAALVVGKAHGKGHAKAAAAPRAEAPAPSQDGTMTTLGGSSRYTGGEWWESNGAWGY
jgi:hypothetical protein